MRCSMSLGADTNPQSVIEAMRWAAVISKTGGRCSWGSSIARNG